MKYNPLHMFDPFRSTNAVTSRWKAMLARSCAEAFESLSLPAPHTFICSREDFPALCVGVVSPCNAQSMRVVFGRPHAALEMLWSGVADIHSANLGLADLVETSMHLGAADTKAVLARPSVVMKARSSTGRDAAFVFDAARAAEIDRNVVEASVDRILDRMDAAVEGYLAVLRLDLCRRVRETLLPSLMTSERSAWFQAVEKSLRFDFGFNRLLIGIFHGASSVFRIEHSFGFDASQQMMVLPSQEEQEKRDSLQQVIHQGGVCLFEPRHGGNENLLPFAEGGPANGSALIPLHLGSRSLGFIYADRFHSCGLTLLAEPMESLQRMATAALVTFQQKHEAEELAHRDPLTGLYNRRYLDRVIDIEATRMKRYSRPLSLMMVDLCDFKRINDQHGHVYGDLLLRETAQLLRNSVREPDIVVRFGGDEFVVLLPNTQAEQAVIARLRVEKAFLERNNAHADPSTWIELSIGMKTADASNIHRLIEDADRQMYSQKTERTKRRILEVLLNLPGHSSDLLDNVITSLLTSLKKREPFYAGHSQRVAFLCLVMARDLNLPVIDIRSILLAALLHDVGKVSLPGEILRRPGPLEAAEREAIQAHPTIGEEFFRGLQYMEDARPIIRHHHERWDGMREGNYPAYPDGLRGEDIPLGARILKLADSMDAMLSERPYKPAQTPEEVRAELGRERGRAFDPKLVDLMMRDMPWDKYGSIEELHELYQSVMRQSDLGGEALSG